MHDTAYDGVQFLRLDSRILPDRHLCRKKPHLESRSVFMTKVAPMVLGQPMDPAAILNSMLGFPTGSPVGTIMHFMLGLVIFPIGYMLIPFRLPSGVSSQIIWDILIYK